MAQGPLSVCRCRYLMLGPSSARRLVANVRRNQGQDALTVTTTDRQARSDIATSAECQVQSLSTDNYSSRIASFLSCVGSIMSGEGKEVASGSARVSKRTRSSASSPAKGDDSSRQPEPSTSSSGLPSSARADSPLTDLSDAESELSSLPSSPITAAGSPQSSPSSSRSIRSSRTPDFSSSLTRASANYLRDSDMESDVDFADLLERAKRPEPEPKPPRARRDKQKGKARAESEVADESQPPTQTELPFGCVAVQRKNKPQLTA